jgi:hypothetical protein
VLVAPDGSPAGNRGRTGLAVILDAAKAGVYYSPIAVGNKLFGD